jgi:hypothetical protein
MNRFSLLDSRLVFDLPRRLTDVVSWHEHIPFAFFCVERLEPRVFVELGTWKGDSYCAFCQAIQTLDVSTKCYAVDSWKGDEETGSYGPEVLEELRGHHDPLYGGFSRLVEQSFDEASAYFADRSIDLLHIDGYHSYDAVRHDFETWLPKLSERGVVLLHDTNVRERNFGVWRLWEEVSQEYPSLAFTHGHGLGVLAIGSSVDSEFVQFLEEAARPESNIAPFFFAVGSRISLGGREERLLAELEWRRRDVAAKEANLAASNAEVRRLETALRGMVQSLSWRITAPLRRVHATLHRAGRRTASRRAVRTARGATPDKPPG